MNNSLKVAAVALLAFAAGVGLTLLWLDNPTQVDQSAEKDSAKPLYWVAPMDANYRRDKPGKSPMGMDLVPVYADDAQADLAGTIKISAAQINNLGVRTARVERGLTLDPIRTVGYVQYDEDRLIHIHPRVQGWIEKLYVKASGDPVTAGEALYELYSPELVNAQEELLLALGRNNAKLVKAARDRLRALLLPDTAIEALERDRQVQQTVTFFAPQSGVVDNLAIREGFFVQPGTTLMSIGSLDSVWVEAEVFERQTVGLKVGLPVSMQLDYLPGRDWKGQVDYIYPSLQEATRTLRVRLRFDNTDHLLRPNMFAQITIGSGSQANSLAIPREAVIRSDSENRVVLALDDGRFRSTPIHLGRVTNRQAEVLHGLAEGDEVVTSAQFLLDSESSKRASLDRLEGPADEPPQEMHHHGEHHHD